MTPLISILVSFALLGGFLALVIYETKQGVRFLPQTRERLDVLVTRGTFVVEHVDFAAFLRDTVRTGVNRLVHDVAHLSLLFVRTIERFLTRVVRYLRTRNAVDMVPHKNAREFVQKLSDFKGQLQETPPKIPDILEKMPE